jgi:hypothetical protein
MNTLRILFLVLVCCVLPLNAACRVVTGGQYDISGGVSRGGK